MKLVNRYTKKDGQVKYYQSYGAAWRAATRLNKTAQNGLWFFEMDMNGWYLFFAADEVIAK